MGTRSSILPPPTSFSTTATVGKKKSRDSVVFIKVNDRYWAGRVLFFLGHTPPGVAVDCESTLFIADVKWYNHVPQRQAMSPVLGWPTLRYTWAA